MSKLKISSGFALKTLLLASLVTIGSTTSAADSELYTKLRELQQNGKSSEAIQLLQKEIQKNSSGEDRKLLPFSLAMLYYNSGDYEKAITAFEDILKEKTNLEEYAYFYRGMAYFKLGKMTEAQNEFKKVESAAPNVKLKIDSISMMGQIALQQNAFKDARNHFQKIEKRTRGTEEYPEVLYFLAMSEQGLDNHRVMCKWAEKIYSRYPASPRIKDWGFDLAENKIGTKATGCASGLDDFRSRVRHLIFAGYDKKAQDEINGIRERLVKEDPYLADQVQAQYFAQQGELTKAYELLKPYYEKKKNHFGYLITFASVSARAGEVQAAVGSYYSAYKMSPRAKQAKEALYQSAFLSYQFQDYDGAARRFKEFMKVYPNSALNRDAKWQLAWIKYLKGDYQGAYVTFKQLQSEKGRGRRGRAKYPADRMNYWMAMSLYRQEKFDQAKTLFDDLAKDPLMGYYSIAAQYRLKKIQGLAPKIASRGMASEYAPRWASRMPSSEFMIPTVDDRMMLPMDTAERETEEGLVMQELAEESGDVDSNEAAEGTDEKQVEVAELTETDKEQGASPVLAKRFEKARDLMSVGLEDWAKWDLYDIEKKTRNKDFMKSLMTEYNSVGYFHRSSYIGQVYFSGQRSTGLEISRNFWEYAYPKAFSGYVEKYSKDFSVPNELVWGIMRAESQYRKDAISPVGALGLMQVMPFTGYRVANLLGEKDFQPRQLLEPSAAIKMGSRYLQRLMVKFDNTIPLVAAGYNAGPHRVKNWLASFGHLETDEFIEHIPFLETRNYVKKVVSNCHVYSQLYGNKKDLFAYLVDPIPHQTDGQMVQKESWDDI
ncbi:transglycosylase SLT domain-containing protein [Bdellovibrio sp. HCB337]|uniref:transglycosylase SLT domain-containing protein n=1 Tax=Bdellovibrio sp. HCB337 TaxID=3394358 RepID=UPI0039A5FB5E